MKKTLTTLAIIYLLLSTPMLIVGTLITIRMATSENHSSGLFSVLLGIIGIIIPAICVGCSIRYLRKKSEDSAYGISILSGLLAFSLANAVIPKSRTPPDTIEFAGLLFALFVGVFCHKTFYKYIKQHHAENRA